MRLLLFAFINTKIENNWFSKYLQDTHLLGFRRAPVYTVAIPLLLIGFITMCWTIWWVSPLLPSSACPFHLPLWTVSTPSADRKDSVMTSATICAGKRLKSVSWSLRPLSFRFRIQMPWQIANNAPRLPLLCGNPAA